MSVKVLSAYGPCNPWLMMEDRVLALTLSIHILNRPHRVLLRADLVPSTLNTPCDVRVGHVHFKPATAH